MFKRKRNAFTLIELVAVLVIMAIIALIVTPLVMSIIKKAKLSADKRSIDAYGRSIELAIAGYLMDTGSFPTSIDQLTIEYSGDEVVCTTTNLNSDSSVYLAGCTVGGRSIEGYIYGKEEAPTYQAYSVGDEVTYNNVDYYVIKDSGISEGIVTLLKAKPLTIAEVNLYGGVETANNHVNMYSCRPSDSWCYQKAYNFNGYGYYGGMAYYSSETCGYTCEMIGTISSCSSQSSGCKTDYAKSDIKYVVDAWKIAQAPDAIDARLITLDELTDNLGIELNANNQIIVNEDIEEWVIGENYWYWTMTPNTNGTGTVWYVYDRPVIVLPKSAL